MLSKRIILGSLAICLLMTQPVAAEIAAVDLESIIAEAPSEEAYPDADAVILFQRITFDIDAQGRLSRRVHQLHKLFSEWACRNLSDSRVGWDETRQKLVINTCRTTMSDGATVVTPQRGFNEVTPDAVMRCPDFLSYREMVISHVGVERDCIIELEYEIRDLTPSPLPASGLEFLQGELPILIKQVVVTAPASSFLTWHGTNGAPTVPQISQNSDKQVVAWTVHEAPPSPREGNAQRLGDYLPYVIFSTAPDWSFMAEQLRTLTLSANSASPDLQAWLQQATSDSAAGASDLTDLHTVQRIAGLLGKRIRTVHPVDEGWGRQPRSADVVFNTSYGTAWEKAILGLTLLQEAGFKAELAFFSRWDSFVTEIATPASFSAVRLVTPVSGENYWLNPDSDLAFPGRCDLVGRTGLFLEDSAQKFRSYVVSTSPGHCHLAVAMQPTDDGTYQAEVDLRATGDFWQFTDPQDPNQLAEQIGAALLPEGEVTTSEIVQKSPTELHLRLTATGSYLAEERDGLFVVSLPTPPHSLLSLLPGSFQMAAEERQTPLFLPNDLTEEVTLQLQLPDGMRVDYLPAADSMTSDHGGFELTVTQNGKSLELERRVSITAGTVAPADYPAFRQFLVKTAEPSSGRCILISE